MSFPFSWILGITQWMPFDANPIDCFLQGIIGACGISVLCSLLRIQLFTQTRRNDSANGHDRKDGLVSAGSGVGGQWGKMLQFCLLTALLSLIGSRVSSLIVLEFSLRTVAASVTAGLDVPRDSQLFMVQCQFSLGCALTCTLSFLQQGAPHSSLSLLLAAGLSWVLSGICHNLWVHVATVYPKHSAERSCGKCISLQTSGHQIQLLVQKMVTVTFGIASAASVATFYHHFLSQEEAMKFWTPLTLCYTMLLVYIQEDQHRHPGGETLSHAVVLRLGALLVLMLTVGHWADVLDILITFLGEAICLFSSRDLLRAPEEDDEDQSPSE